MIKLNTSKLNDTRADVDSMANPKISRDVVRLVPFDIVFEQKNQKDKGLLTPVYQSGGIIFPFRPSISEGNRAKYGSVEMVHTNETVMSFAGKETVRINISGGTWTCDTVANAMYAASVMHFFRTQTLMDFGKGKTGRPPMPLFLYAYGQFAYDGVPVIMESADITFPSDVDYVKIPNPNKFPDLYSEGLGSDNYADGVYDSANSSTDTMYFPSMFRIEGISLIVQHSVDWWINKFDLEDYRTGRISKLSSGNLGFHVGGGS